MRADRSTGWNKLLWAGHILSGLVTLFFVMDGGMKLFKPSFVVQATSRLRKNGFRDLNSLQPQ
jgi:hypothetical protein